MAENRYAVDSIRRALELLRALVEQGHLSLDEAARLSGVAKSTAFRMLETLQAIELAERVPSGGYRPGPEALRWGLLLLGRLDVPEVAAGELRSLWLDARETVGLAMLSGRRIVLAEILESPYPFRMAEVPGTTVPAHSSALGRAVAAYLDGAVLEGVLGSEPFQVVSPDSPERIDDLLPMLETIRRNGYSLEIGESALGVACVAAPVFKRDQVVGAISIAGPRVRMSDERLEDLGRMVAEAAQRISARLSPGMKAPELPPAAAQPSGEPWDTESYSHHTPIPDPSGERSAEPARASR
ncbi:MAG: IclR family transcriptional regulator [Acidimicrobiales bacterium]